ncbi:MAG TPA: rhomboid family intramembrane serine protease [Steroidobacteraceae bacterium]|nr:rhomboid family intramembrane serine protease [Steroidobacteraceae bacterium]
MILIPLTDASRRPTRIPVATAAIIAVNVLVFLLELGAGDAMVSRWSVIPADVAAGRHWITILTAMFMHGSWLHIIGNMVFLWAFGPQVEDLMGRGRYLAFYLLGGVIAALAQVMADPASTVPNLGASGAIAAVMGAFLVSYPHDTIRSLLVIFVFVRVAYVPAVLLIGVWGVIQFLSLRTGAPQGGGGGVAYAAHVGGFIFGTIAARLFVRGGGDSKLEWAR